jgi:hypothetical protein
VLPNQLFFDLVSNEGEVFMQEKRMMQERAWDGAWESGEATLWVGAANESQSANGRLFEIFGSEPREGADKTRSEPKPRAVSPAEHTYAVGDLGVAVEVDR